MPVIMPKTVLTQGFPIVYLGGPGKGGGGWQYKAAEIIQNIDPYQHVVLPLKDESKINKKIQVIGGRQFSGETRDWELNQIKHALKHGVAMYWVLGQVKEVPNGKSYGLITAEELGRISGIAKYNQKINFCIGADGRFPEWKTIEKGLRMNIPNLEIFNTLEETCEKAVEISKSNANFV